VIKKKTQKKTQTKKQKTKMGSTQSSSPAQVNAERLVELRYVEWKKSGGNWPPFYWWNSATDSAFEGSWILSRKDTDFDAPMSEDEIQWLATDWCILLRHAGQRIFEVIGMDDKFICTECSSGVFDSAAEAVKHVCAKHPYSPAVRAAGKE
jgi:hypothetical protein